MDNHRGNGVELSDIFRRFSDQYQSKYTLCPSQQKAYNAIVRCRTAALGMHLSLCDSCGYKQISYNSCRNRHCPKCQYLKQQLWVDKLKSRLLPVRYFHIVFTVPEFLNRLFYINQRSCYDMLFKASALAIQKTAANPSFLGVQSGSVSVLHTWGQALNYHPHIHALVPAGGLDPDGQEWINSARNFFVPIKALSKIFRAVFFELLENGLNNRDLVIPEKDQALYIRRFLQHILPCGYYKIRYYGLFAAIHTKTSMMQCFALLGTAPVISQYEGLTMPEVLFLITGRDTAKCPQCKVGNMVMQSSSPLPIAVVT